MRDGERPELRVASERAPRDVETLLFARGRGLLHVRGGIAHEGDEPPRAPEEAENAEEIKDGGPAAEVEDDRRSDEQTAQRTDVETTESGGHRLGSLARRHALRQDAGRRRRGDALAETDQEPRREERRHAERRAPRRDESTERPEHDAVEQDSLTAVLARQPTSRDLRERISPEERRRD